MREINIVVAGTTASGKTTFAEYIRQKLGEVGISVNLLDDNGVGIVEQTPEQVTETLNQRLAAINSHNTVVGIRTAQTLRPKP
jgi:uridine kinase